jgi:hypothetical protein
MTQYTLCLLFGLLAFVAGCHRSDPTAGAPGPGTTAVASADLAVAEVLRVGRVTGQLRLNGELDEADWPTSARTGPFVDAHGAEARPFSEAHFLWDDENLYVALYAADDNIRATVKAHDGPVWIDDSFSLHLAPSGASGPTFLFDISAMGVTTDVARDARGKKDVSWESGIRAHVDRDGTANDVHDEDEEWVVEAAIPWRSMSLAAAPGVRFAIELGRCDTPRAAGSARRCGGWGTGKGRLLELAASGSTVPSGSRSVSP